MPQCFLLPNKTDQISCDTIFFIIIFLPYSSSLIFVLLYYAVSAIMRTSEYVLTSSTTILGKSLPIYPEEPYYCVFNLGETVWIRRSIQDGWQLGQVTDIDNSSRKRHRTYYTIEYVLHHPINSNVKGTTTARDMFDPLDGFVKPDNKEIRNLLKRFGHLPSEMEQVVQLFDVLARIEYHEDGVNHDEK